MTKNLIFKIDGKIVSKTVDYTVNSNDKTVIAGVQKALSLVQGVNAYNLMRQAVEAGLITCDYITEKKNFKQASDLLTSLIEKVGV